MRCGGRASHPKAVLGGEEAGFIVLVLAVLPVPSELCGMEGFGLSAFVLLMASVNMGPLMFKRTLMHTDVQANACVCACVRAPMFARQACAHSCLHVYA